MSGSDVVGRVVNVRNGQWYENGIHWYFCVGFLKIAIIAHNGHRKYGVNGRFEIVSGILDLYENTNNLATAQKMVADGYKKFLKDLEGIE